MRLLEGHIGPLEGGILLFAVLAARLFTQAPATLIEAGGPAAWMVALIMLAGLLIAFLPIAALAKRHPGKGLPAIAEEVAGPFVGGFLSLLTATWFLLTVGESTRNFSETFTASVLPETPTSILVLALVLSMAYTSYKGLEALARTNQVLSVLIGLGVIMAVVASLPRADISLLYPFWGHGLPETVAGGLWNITIGAEIVMLLAINYAFRSGKEFVRSGYVGIVLFGVAAVTIITVLVLLFGAPMAAQRPYPVFYLSRLIYFGWFVQRVESLMVLFWIFAAVVRLGALFHITVALFTDSLRLPHYRPVIFPMAVLVATLAFSPSTFISVLRLESDYLRPAGFIILAIPAVLLLLSHVRRKGGVSA